jgi:DNA-binding response OmpR family regulator
MRGRFGGDQRGASPRHGAPYGLLPSDRPDTGMSACAGSVLVVEDEPTIADVVARYLRRAGYETDVVGDGAAALAAVEERQPDLVVLDIMLPSLSGLEVLRRIRRGDQHRVAVVLLTARGDEADRIAGLQHGADDYVVKPFSPAELTARVAAVLRRTRRAPSVPWSSAGCTSTSPRIGSYATAKRSRSPSASSSCSSASPVIRAGSSRATS